MAQVTSRPCRVTLSGTCALLIQVAAILHKKDFGGDHKILHRELSSASSATIQTASSPARITMGKASFTTNPYPNLVLTEADREMLLELERDLIHEVFPKYEAFVVEDKRKVKRAQWKAIGDDKNLHVYVERKDWSDAENEPMLSQDTSDNWQKHMPVILAVGTFEGELNDLMFGTVNPTQQIMRVKASFGLPRVGAFRKGTCKLCMSPVCLKCKRPKAISFLTPDGKLLRHKITFCVKCISEVTQLDALPAARDQAEGYQAYSVMASLSGSDVLSDDLDF
ncbi:hypothetical protein PRIC2_014065 [Phytophthora ramorum]